MPSDRQSVEFFHLAFVRLLCAGPDKDAYVIKGGCNLRFFFGSIRYSEDIDLDVSERVPVHVLKEKVARILAAPALALPLRSQGLEVGEVSAPKQTETTQRWKIALTAGRAALHTKIEFSRRPTEEPSEVAAVGAEVLAEHQVLPLVARHYGTGAAIRQKVHALADRRLVQARDVYDLAVLFARSGRPGDELRAVRDRLPKALERLMDVSYADFKAQVVSYLVPEQAAAYSSRQAWDALQENVLEHLERARGADRGRDG